MNSKLAEDIKLAIGSRSYSQVASATNISKATISRMVRQTYTRSIGPKLLWELSVSAQNNITFELLMTDAGFSTEEIKAYRIRFGGTGSSSAKHMDLTTKMLLHLILSMLLELNPDINYKIIPYSVETAVLTITETNGIDKNVYVIDGMPQDSLESSNRRVCELIGRCILEKTTPKINIRLATSSFERYSILISSPPVFAKEILLANETCESIKERKSI